MTEIEIGKIVIGILMALGGGGGIVLGLSNYFGQFLAKRYEERIKANFQKEISEYQTQLDIIKQSTIRYSDKQFEYYSKLWASLHDLKILSDDLWQQASSARLFKFSKQLKLTKSEMEKASLFIEEGHYVGLMSILRCFLEYQIGKSRLIDWRERDYDNFQVQEMIANNGVKKAEFERLILEVKADLKKQIGGK